MRYAPLVQISELCDADEESTPRVTVQEVPSHVWGQVKVKLQKLEKFDEVWRSAGIAVKEKASI